MFILTSSLINILDRADAFRQGKLALLSVQQAFVEWKRNCGADLMFLQWKMQIAAGFNKMLNISQLGTREEKPERLLIAFTDGGNESNPTGRAERERREYRSPGLLLSD